MLTSRFGFLAIFSASLVACGGASGEPAQSPSTAGAASTSSVAAGSSGGGAVALKAQIDAGEHLYKDKCSSCHGTKGEGDGESPAVVGAKSLPIAPPAGAKIRKGEFKNAEDVAAFVKKAMPIDDPGSLSADQSYAVTAWELSLTGSQLGDKPLDATDATSIVVHPR